MSSVARYWMMASGSYPAMKRVFAVVASDWRIWAASFSSSFMNATSRESTARTAFGGILMIDANASAAPPHNGMIVPSANRRRAVE